MRYLCLVSCGYAMGTLACAYWLPRQWMLPLELLLLGLGLLSMLLRRWVCSRWMLRVALLSFSASLALGAYAFHWRYTVVPARALDDTLVQASLELKESPRTGTYSYRALGDLYLNGEQYSVQCWLENPGDLQPGDRLSGDFQLSLPTDESEDGLEAGYLRSCGVYLICKPVEEYTVQRPARLPLRHWPKLLRNRITEVCKRVFDARTAPWFIALLTNQNEYFSYADRNDMKLAGLYHCMCTSGMHIHMLLGLVFLLSMRHRRLGTLFGLPICMFFWSVAGGTPSVTRAIVMQALLLFAPLLRMEYDALTSMALALLLTLIAQPDAIAHMGLQLSYLSVGGISLFTPPLYEWIKERKLMCRLEEYRQPYRIATALFSSLSTAIGAILLTTPFLAWRFGLVSLIAPLSGLLVLPLVSLCFAVGLPLSLLIALFPTLGVLALPLNWMMRCIIALTHWFADIPALYISSPYWVVWLVLSYGLLLTLWLGKPRIWIVLSAIALSFCLSLGLHHLELFRTRSDFRVTALDVGQGQCLIVELDGKVCVVDCGGSYPEEAGELCARWLLGRGIHRIDLLALTHYHADHAGGAEQLLSRIETDLVLLPDVLDETGNRAAIASQTDRIRWIATDETLPLNNGTLRVYAPRSQESDNEACLAFLLSYDDTDLLVTGDMDREAEILLCKTAFLPDLELFVAGHHGSRDSNSSTLLNLTRPETVIISCSDRFGHPNDEALARIVDSGATILCTKTDGTIIIQR